MSLKVSPTLAVPLEYATDATAILGKRGSGKTNTAVVFVEEMLAAGLPIIVVDTVGVWWGIRSSADGNKTGYDVVVFGGEHGDVPLEEKSGVVIADAILDHGLSAVIDTSGLGKTASKRFLLAFVTHIYHRKAKDRTPLHVVFDEADDLAPQSTSGGGPEGPMLLSAMEDFVRRGRSRGLGCTLVTQRPAVLNKDVLTQVEILIAMRMTGPRDVAAIDEWVKLHAEPDVAQQVKRTLAALPTGTGWVWSPDFLDILEKVTFRPRQTFDSSATPKIGEVRQEPKARTVVDLAQLGEQIAATVERAKADDPKALRAKIAELERHIRDRAPEKVQVPVEVIREVPVLPPEFAEEIREAARGMERSSNLIAQALAKWAHGIVAPVSVRPDVRLREPKRDRPRTATPPPAPTSAATVQPAIVTPGPSALRKLAKAERLVLTVLAQRGEQTQQQVAMLTGYAVNGGGFNNALGSLRSAGMLEGTRNGLHLTVEGLESLGAFEPMPTGQALIDFWLSKFGRAERLILEYLISLWPEPASRDDIAAATGYEPNGGGFNNAIGRLRTLTLLKGERGQPITVTDELGEARNA